MPTQFDAKTWLQTAYQIFNNQQFNLLPLDNYIIWQKLHSPDILSTKTSVINWLKTNKTAEKPYFSPDLNKLKVTSVGSIVQMVTGSGTWQRPNIDANPDILAFRYTFLWNEEQGDWLLKEAFGIIYIP